MRRLLLACLALALVCTLPLSAAGTVTSTAPVTVLVARESVTRYTFTWTSDGSGNVNAHLSTFAAVTRGYIIQVRFTPTSGGTTPTAAYDVTLADTTGVDLLAGGGADLSATAGKLLTFTNRPFLDSGTSLDLVVANAGAAKSGVVTVWLQR